MDDSDIERLVNGHPAFSNITIPAKPTPPKQHAVTTFGTRMILVASEDLDLETTYKLIQTIDRYHKNLQSAHPALSSFTIKAAPDLEFGIPLHPGPPNFFLSNDHVTDQQSAWSAM